MTCITFGFKPDKEKAPEWATHMIMVENEPEIWYFAENHGSQYVVYELIEGEWKMIIIYTEHSIVYGGIHPVE